MQSNSCRTFVLLLALSAALSGCRRERETPADVKLAEANKVTAHTVQLYFESPDMLLIAEPRSVGLPESSAAAMPALLRELIKGSVNPGVPKPFPADTELRGAYLLADGTAVVDLGGPTLAAGWNTGSHQEMMAAYSVVQTVIANVPEAKRVRLLVNGQPAETLAGHLTIDRPLLPMASLLRKPASPAAEKAPAKANSR
ncbi:MAG: GerMN domain-containing protein [Thermoanaerobaculia bacterium]